MINRLKTAFSLTELLIAITIISILTVMLLNISKKGMENAYDLYYYTGYKGMSDAISYSNERSGDSDNLLHSQYIAEAFGLLNELNQPDQTDNIQITTKNGISYDINDAQNKIRYIIEMTIPSANGDIKVMLLYFKNSNGILFPYRAVLPDNRTIELYNKKTLLPFYIDNGEQGSSIVYYDDKDGKMKKSPNANANANKRKYLSFKNAYCSLDPTLSNPDIISFLECQSGTEKGFIRVANPRKVF